MPIQLLIKIYILTVSLNNHNKDNNDVDDDFFFPFDWLCQILCPVRVAKWVVRCRSFADDDDHCHLIIDFSFHRCHVLLHLLLFIVIFLCLDSNTPFRHRAQLQVLTSVLVEPGPALNQLDQLLPFGLRAQFYRRWCKLIGKLGRPKLFPILVPSQLALRSVELGAGPCH